MHGLNRLWLAAAATVSMGGATLADEASGPGLDFNIGAATDYVFRGVSQTDQGPQVFGGVDVGFDKFYAGAWASNVDFGDSTDAEIDVYAGFKPMIGPVSVDLAAIYYGYVDAPSGSDYGYWEFKAAGSIPVGPATLGAAFYYSPDFFGGVGDAYYYEINGSYPLMKRISASGALGRQQVQGTGDYTTWNLGLGYAINDHLGLDLRYHDTDEHGFGKLYDSRLAVSVKAAF
jgi:uncharacterized protein (TIGR02001 family)